MKRVGRAVLTTCGLCCECSTWFKYAPCGVTPNEICGDLPDAVFVCTTAHCADGPLDGRGFLRGGYCWTRVDATVYENVTGIDPAEVLTCITGCSDPRCPAEPMVVPGRPCRAGDPPVYVCAAGLAECIHARHNGRCYGWYPEDAVPVSSIPSGSTVLPVAPTLRWDGCCGCDPLCEGVTQVQNLFSDADLPSNLRGLTRTCCCANPIPDGAQVITRVTDRATYSDGVVTGVDILGTVRLENGQPVTTGTRRDFDSRTGEVVRQLLPGEIADPSCGVSPTVAQLGGTFFPPGFGNVTVEEFTWTCLVVRIVLRYAPPPVQGQPTLVQTTVIDVWQNTLGSNMPCTRLCDETDPFDVP